MNKVKFLRGCNDQDSALKVIISQYFGMVYYGAAVWLTSQLDATSWRRLYISHYSALRAAFGDCKRKSSTPYPSSGLTIPWEWQSNSLMEEKQD